MKLDRQSLLLYAVTDRTWLEGNSLADQVEEAVRSGVTFVQLREKDLSFAEFARQARQIKTITDRYQIPFVINDDIEVAIDCGADGVHVGQNDMKAKDVRSLIGKDKILGVSVQAVDQALQAEKDGADYLGVGAMFSTATKADADDVSLSTLKAICAAVSIPVVAIGGISTDNLTQLAGTGIVGVAVVSALFAEKDIAKAARQLRSLAESSFR